LSSPEKIPPSRPNLGDRGWPSPGSSKMAAFA
jgi:hypothetical protein